MHNEYDFDSNIINGGLLQGNIEKEQIINDYSTTGIPGFLKKTGGIIGSTPYYTEY